MNCRTTLTAAALVACTALIGCGGRQQPDAGNGGGTTGVGGGTSVGGGTGGSTGGGTGGSTGGGTGGTGGSGAMVVTVAQAKNATFCTQQLTLAGVVVTAIDDAFAGTQGDINARFWVADPNTAGNGIYVDKFFTDTPTAYNPAIGDVLTITGWLDTEFRYNDRYANRLVIKSQFGCGAGMNTGLMAIVKSGSMAPLADVTAPAGFGISDDGGIYRANKALAGSRVHVPGPLTLSDATPAELRGGATNTFFGFSVTGAGIGPFSVNNYKTFGTTQDGGTVRCDWRRIAADGGTVTFPDGISGVWDSYSHAPCFDGGVSCSHSTSAKERDAGFVPPTGLTYTYELFPQDCANDLPGMAQ